MSDDGCGIGNRKRTPASDGGRSLLTRIFGVLSHPRRRYVLYYLRDRETVRTGELAERVAAWERDQSVDEVAGGDVERVETDLRHTHLPKLADYGLVEYDSRSDTVRYVHSPALLDEALDLTASFENPP